MRRLPITMALALCAAATLHLPSAASPPPGPEGAEACVRPPLPLTKDERVRCLNHALGLVAERSATRTVPMAPAAPGPCGGEIPLYDDRCERWAHVYANPGSTGTGGMGDHARDIAADPLGRFAFATGLSQDGSTGPDYATVAVSAVTGQRAWAARWDGDGSDDRPWQLDVSRDGSKVFVTGTRDFSDGSADQQTVAYDAATGAELWSARVSRPQDDWGVGVVASPDGSRVYVSALSEGSNATDVGITAYEAGTGEVVWTERFGTVAPDQVADMTISEDGRTLFVVADTREGSGFATDYLTMAIETGIDDDETEQPSVRWTGRWGGGWLDWPFAIEEQVGRVVVTGLVGGDSPAPGLVTNLDVGTVSYDAATGAERWSHRYHSDHGGPNGAFDLAVTPDGSTVLATGQITGLATPMDLDYGTVALDGASGALRWVARHQLPGAMFEFGFSVDVSPSGNRAYVTGWASADAFAGSVVQGHMGTIAYDTANGSQVWVARYANDPPFSAYGQRIAVAPSGRVFVAGTRFQFASASGNPADIGILAYDP